MEKNPFILNLIAFALIIVIPTTLKSDSRDLFIVWDVGQGQWTTLLENEKCIHFDAGGEKAPWPAIRTLCGEQKNVLEISHWDSDHINQIKKLSGNTPLCIERTGDLRFANPKKRKILQTIDRCPKSKKMFWSWSPLLARDANSSSQVFLVQGFLIAGDSPKHQEKIWSGLLPKSEKIKVLILGHHGSRTSTSSILLSRLPWLKMAIASSRYAKYGHPHLKTRSALRQFQVAMLTTEDWGTIGFEL